LINALKQIKLLSLDHRCFVDTSEKTVGKIHTFEQLRIFSSKRKLQRSLNLPKHRQLFSSLSLEGSLVPVHEENARKSYK